MLNSFYLYFLKPMQLTLTNIWIVAALHILKHFSSGLFTRSYISIDIVYNLYIIQTHSQLRECEWSVYVWLYSPSVWNAQADLHRIWCANIFSFHLICDFMNMCQLGLGDGGGLLVLSLFCPIWNYFEAAFLWVKKSLLAVTWGCAVDNCCQLTLV